MLRRNYLGITLALLLAIGAFGSGFLTGQLSGPSDEKANFITAITKPPEATANEGADLAEFWKVWSLLEEKFIAGKDEEVTSEKKIHGAIEGMVKAYGDPYTTFMPPAESQVFTQDISGNFSGVGMEVGIKDNVITVIAPLPDTPAAKAGLLAGDLILKIDDKSTEGMKIDEAVSLIRGEKGTEVKFSVYREGETEIREIVVVRDTIEIPTIKTEMVGKTLVVSLYSFNAVAEEKMLEALKEYKDKKATSLILDLRGNPGGYLQSAVAIAGYFLPAGKVVVKERFGDEVEEKLYRSQGRVQGNFSPSNFVILVDNGSASASEILAGALKEHQAATVIGVDTFGKGSVQELVELPSGAALKVTIARWLTPEGVSISEGGLKPNIKISRTAEDRLSGIDAQRDAALKFLKGEKVEGEEEKELPSS